MLATRSPSRNGTFLIRPPTSIFLTVAACQILAPTLFVFSLFGIVHERAAFSAASNPQSRARTRPCSSSARLSPGSKAANESLKTKSAETPAPPPACLEAKGELIELQEFLRAFIRDEKWRTGPEQASAEGLNFVRYLEPDELARLAHTEILGGRIAWTEGKVAVRVTTSRAADGYTQVRITAKFQGKGNAKERFARPADLWPLASRGTLEGSMIAALESRADSSRR
jgi:hypothetical protein